MPACQCELNAVVWIRDFLGDCAYSSWDVAGVLIGLSSMAFWIVAQLPQFISNIQRQSADGLSPWFLFQWLSGDTLNLLGCILTGDQLATETYTAIYFIFADCCIISQYVYYQTLNNDKTELEADVCESEDSSVHAERAIVEAFQKTQISKSRSKQPPLGPLHLDARVGEGTTDEGALVVNSVDKRQKERHNPHHHHYHPVTFFTGRSGAVMIAHAWQGPHLPTSPPSLGDHQGDGNPTPNRGVASVDLLEQEGGSDDTAGALANNSRPKHAGSGGQHREDFGIRPTQEVSQRTLRRVVEKYGLEYGPPLHPRLTILHGRQHLAPHEVGFSSNEQTRERQPERNSAARSLRRTGLIQPFRLRNTEEIDSDSGAQVVQQDGSALGVPSESDNARPQAEQRQAGTRRTLACFASLFLCSTLLRTFSPGELGASFPVPGAGTFRVPSNVLATEGRGGAYPSSFQGSGDGPVQGLGRRGLKGLSDGSTDNGDSSSTSWQHVLRFKFDSERVRETWRVLGKQVIVMCGTSNSEGWVRHIGLYLGWASACLYLGSRVAQIVQNNQRRSAEGLSLAMFGCAFMANLAYGLAILLRAKNWSEIVSKGPWLVGSMGTLSLDVTIYCQAFYYRSRSDGTAVFKRVAAIARVKEVAGIASAKEAAEAAPLLH